MMEKLKFWLNARRRDQRGASLIEVVIALALFSVLSGTVIYASIVIEDARKTSLQQTTSTISQTGISNSFRNDVSKAKALRFEEETGSLAVARADGACVIWTVRTNPGASSSSLVRASAQGSAPTLESGSELAEAIEVGSLSLSSNSAELNLSFSSGEDFRESVSLSSQDLMEVSAGEHGQELATS